MCWAVLLASLLLFVGGRLFGFRVSICAGGFLLTFAVRCGTLQLRTVGVVDRLLTIDDALSSYVWDFISVMEGFAIKGSLRCISSLLHWQECSTKSLAALARVAPIVQSFSAHL